MQTQNAQDAQTTSNATTTEPLLECYFQDLNDPFKYYERVWKNGETKIFPINEKFEYYVEDPLGNYRYVLNPEIKLKKVNRKPDTKTYGNHNPAQVRVRDKYWKADNSLYNENANVWWLDIETTAYNNIDTDNCPEEIVLIQIFDTSKKQMFVIGTKNTEIREYDYKVNFLLAKTEKHLLEIYFKLIKILKPLVVYAWNGNGFDYIYMFKRSLRNNLSPDFGLLEGSKLNTRKLDNGQLYYSLQAPGVIYMDYMELYKKYIFEPRASYSLDFIAQAELGKGKVEHDCFSTFDGFRTGRDYIMPSKRPEDNFESQIYDCYINNDMQKAEEIAYNQFVHYGIIDTYLLYQINERTHLHKIAMMIASTMGVNIDDALGTVKPWATYIDFVLYKTDRIMPNDEPADRATIKGGFVSEPVAGKHSWIVSDDINSAYPNLSMRGFNMSPETFIPEDKIPEDLKKLRNKLFNDEDEERRFNDYLNNNLNEYHNLLKKYNLSAGVNGALFRKDEKGIVPELVGDLYGKRKQIKKEMLEHEKNIELIKSILHKRNIKI